MQAPVLKADCRCVGSSRLLSVSPGFSVLLRQARSLALPFHTPCPSQFGGNFGGNFYDLAPGWALVRERDKASPVLPRQEHGARWPPGNIVTCYSTGI